MRRRRLLAQAAAAALLFASPALAEKVQIDPAFNAVTIWNPSCNGGLGGIVGVGSCALTSGSGGSSAQGAPNTGGAANAWWTQGIETPGAFLTGGGVRIMGSDGTNARDILTDTGGRLYVNLNSVTPLGLETISYITTSGGTASGAAHTLASAIGSPAQYGCMVANVYSDQAGTAEIDETVDGTNYYPAATPQAMTAATWLTIKAPALGVTANVKITNGTTAETVLRVFDGLMSTCGG